MARIIDHNEEPIEDLDAGVAADDVRGGTLPAYALVKSNGTISTTQGLAAVPLTAAQSQQAAEYNTLVEIFESTPGVSVAAAEAAASADIYGT